MPFSLVMVRAIRDYHRLTGYKIGYKPAGGISKAKEALAYLVLMKEELGDPGWSRSCSGLAPAVCWAISNDSSNTT